MAIDHSDQPFFSVVIPTYNRAKHLTTSLNAILKQEFSDFEVLIIDDGSVDETRAVVAKIAGENSRIKYFYKENEERSIARNYGIMKAIGKYVGFLDSDDLVYPNHLKVAYDLLNRNNFPEVGHLGFKVIDESGNTILSRNAFNNSFKEELIHQNILHGNAIFIRKDIASEIHFIPSRFANLGEDWYLWLRLAARYVFYFDNTVTSAVVQHNDRSLMNINPDKLIASTETLVTYLQKDEQFLREYKRKAAYHFANHYTFLTLILALTKKRRGDTIKYLAKAISYDPMVVLRRRFLASLKHFF